MRSTPRSCEIALAIAISFSVSYPAAAVDQIRDERWASTVEPDGFTHVIVQFVADITASDLDPGQGVRFAMAARHAGAPNEVLVRYALEAQPLPPLGTPVVVSTGVVLRCDAAGRVEAQPEFWEIQWCDPEIGQQARYGEMPGPGQVIRSEGSGPFQFVLEDENDLEGATPSAEAAFGCAGVTSLTTTGVPMGHPFDGLVGLPGVEALFGPGLAAIRGGLSLESPSRKVPAGTLALSFEPLGVRCVGSALVGEALHLYVVMQVDGATGCGIAGAEFRVEGLPGEWFASLEGSPPGAWVVGNPLAPGGLIAFPCQSGTNGIVTVADILVLPTSVVQDRVVRIVRHATPSNPYHWCPVAVACDRPFFSGYCVEGGRAVLNPVALDCDDPTAVRPSSWSEIKNLYRQRESHPLDP